MVNVDDGRWRPAGRLAGRRVCLQDAVRRLRKPAGTARWTSTDTVAKPNRLVTCWRRAGNRAWPFGRKQRLKVVVLAERHVAKAERAPAVRGSSRRRRRPKRLELRRQERIFHAAMTPPQSPDKRQRRALPANARENVPRAALLLLLGRVAAGCRFRFNLRRRHRSRP